MFKFGDRQHDRRHPPLKNYSPQQNFQFRCGQKSIRCNSRFFCDKNQLITFVLMSTPFDLVRLAKLPLFPKFHAIFIKWTPQSLRSCTIWSYFNWSIWLQCLLQNYLWIEVTYICCAGPFDVLFHHPLHHKRQRIFNIHLQTNQDWMKMKSSRRIDEVPELENNCS